MFLGAPRETTVWYKNATWLKKSENRCTRQCPRRPCIERIYVRSAGVLTEDGLWCRNTSLRYRIPVLLITPYGSVCCTVFYYRYMYKLLQRDCIAINVYAVLCRNCIVLHRRQTIELSLACTPMGRLKVYRALHAETSPKTAPKWRY